MMDIHDTPERPDSAGPNPENPPVDDTSGAEPKPAPPAMTLIERAMQASGFGRPKEAASPLGTPARNLFTAPPVPDAARAAATQRPFSALQAAPPRPLPLPPEAPSEAPKVDAPVAPPPLARTAPPEQVRPFSSRIWPVDRDRLRAEAVLLPDSGPTAHQEEFRIVKRQLLLQAEDLRRRGGGGAAQRVMVCSPHPGEGKTFCALNLAMSIAAEKDSEVLLVDLDLARHQIMALMGLPSEPGLMEALANPAIDVRDCVMTTDIPGLRVLPGGQPTNSDAEYLASARAIDVLDSLTQDSPGRIVLFDTPPALAATLPVEVAKLVGQVVMVVMAERTSAGAVNDATSLLAGCPNIQLLLNGAQFSPSGRRFGSYYGYAG